MVGSVYVILETHFNEPVEVENVQVEEVKTAEQLFEEAVLKTIEEAISASSTDIEAAKVKAAEEVEAQMKADIEERVRKEMRDRV